MEFELVRFNAENAPVDLDAMISCAAEICGNSGQGRRVLLGIWIGSDPQANELEITRAIATAKANTEQNQCPDREDDCKGSSETAHSS